MAESSSSRERKQQDDKEELLLHHVHSDDDDEGTRQPYKCTFCRRGFPTAQALGGHMNVHRKHRGSTTGSSSATTAAAALQGRISEMIPWSSMATGVAGESMSLSHHAHAAERVAEPKELRLFLAGRDDCAKGAGRDLVQEDRYHYNKHNGDQGEEEELDLELRLGGSAGS